MRCVTDCFGRVVDYGALTFYQILLVASFADFARALHLMSFDAHASIPPQETVEFRGF